MSTPTSALARPHPPAIGTVSSTRLDVAALADIATGLAEAEELWRPHVVHDSVERARVRLLASPVYEVWLLGWTPGQSVGLHDHGGANGAFVVVDGELTETALVDGSLERDVLHAGEFGRVPFGAMHDVGNHSRRNTTSIHAYSRPLSAMGFYLPDGTLERVEAVHEQSTLLEAAAVAATIAR